MVKTRNVKLRKPKKSICACCASEGKAETECNSLTPACLSGENVGGGCVWAWGWWWLKRDIFQQKKHPPRSTAVRLNQHKSLRDAHQSIIAAALHTFETAGFKHNFVFVFFRYTLTRAELNQRISITYQASKAGNLIKFNWFFFSFQFDYGAN